MCMRNSYLAKYCILEIASKPQLNTIPSRQMLKQLAIYNSMQVSINVPVCMFTLCMECCGHTEIVYAFQSIEKITIVMKGRIK